MKKLIIIGAGGFGREVFEWASATPDQGRVWSIAGYLDDQDNPPITGTRAPVLGRVRDHQPRPDEIFICAIGQPAHRRSIHALITTRGGVFATVVHPTATVVPGAVLGHGVIVCPYALVSVGAKIGEGSAIYYHSSIDHDAEIGAWCQISAHCDITGGAILGDEVFVGSHATVLPRLRVGCRAIIGAGAVVTKDVAAGQTVVGMPARPLAS